MINLSPAGVKIFEVAGLEVDNIPGLPPLEGLKKIISNYDLLVIHNTTKGAAGLLDKDYGDRVVGRSGVGLDNVDIPTVSQKGIVVMNTPSGSAGAKPGNCLSRCGNRSLSDDVVIFDLNRS